MVTTTANIFLSDSIQVSQVGEKLRKDYNLDQAKSNRFHEEITDKLHNL